MVLPHTLCILSEKGAKLMSTLEDETTTLKKNSPPFIMSEIVFVVFPPRH